MTHQRSSQTKERQAKRRRRRRRRRKRWKKRGRKRRRRRRRERRRKRRRRRRRGKEHKFGHHGDINGVQNKETDTHTFGILFSWLPERSRDSSTRNSDRSGQVEIRLSWRLRKRILWQP